MGIQPSSRVINSFLLYLLLPVFLVAQTTIQGIVVDYNGNELPGTNVIIKGTTFGASTDENGKYVIHLPTDFAPDDELTVMAEVVGYMYKTEMLAIRQGADTLLDLFLADESWQIPNQPFGTAQEIPLTRMVQLSAETDLYESAPRQILFFAAGPGPVTGFIEQESIATILDEQIITTAGEKSLWYKVAIKRTNINEPLRVGWIYSGKVN